MPSYSRGIRTLQRSGSGRSLKDLTGKTFGRLTALSFHHLGKGHGAYWECLCTCGKTKIARTSSLIAGECKSCGCLGPESNIERRGEYRAAENHEYKIYKHSAARRRKTIPFELTRKEFLHYMYGDCFYCGTQPSRKPSYYGTRKTTKYAPKLMNGIDRVDPLRGYVEGNCVSCCQTCNKMKSDVTLPKFLSHVDKIYRRFYGPSA